MSGEFKSGSKPATVAGKKIKRMSTSAKEFKRLRKMKGYSQTELARLLKVTVRSISRWETGEQKAPEMAVLAVKGLPKKPKDQ